MPIDIVSLATTVVSSFLLPYLQKGADEFLNEVTSKSSKSIAQYTLNVTEKIWERVKSAFSSEGDKVTLGYFEKNPAKFQEEMQENLSSKLMSDQELVVYIYELAHSKPQGSEQTAAQIVTTTINLTISRNVFKNKGDVNISGTRNND